METTLRKIFEHLLQLERKDPKACLFCVSVSADYSKAMKF